jgi:4-methyl-5(b-hydroxyethyl)-thiazole monophosphate biosynthesis
MRVLVPLAEGFEEMEAVILVDLLRRASIETVTAAMGDGQTVAASRGVRLVADTTWSAIDPRTFDLIALPGGMGGTRRLQHDERMLQALRDHHGAGKPVAAICAGPLVLQSAGLLDGREATCHPGVAGELTAARRRDARVVADGAVITSQGPGTAIDFALAIIERLAGRSAADSVAAGLVR